MGGVRVREYDAEDAEAVLQLNQTHLDAVGPLDAERLTWLTDIADRVLVADDADTVAGFVVLIGPDTAYDSPNYHWFLARAPSFLYLDRVVVAPTHRRRGVATALYTAAEELAVPYGAMALEVYAVPPNEGSLAFHAARGYAEVGRLEQSNGNTAAMMSKQLEPCASTRHLNQ
jgi:predicted GNAT superfamily acetyltransferase